MIKQTLALSWINLKSFPYRLSSSFISIISIGFVTATLLSILAIISGMQKTMSNSGLENSVIVMRAGAISELQSVLFSIEGNLLADHLAIERDQRDEPIYSAEMFVNAEYKNQKQQTESLALRGVSQGALHFRPNFKLTQGKLFQSGLREIVIGAAIARRMPELKVGQQIRLGNSDWLIAGIFSDQNSVYESEVWADLKTVQQDYQRGNSIQSIRLALNKIDEFETVKKEWLADPRLNVKVEKEKDYFAAQAENLTRLIRWIGLPVTLIMAIGALVAALNTMYTAIANRSKEIATHKAIGFAPLALSLSIIFEAFVIAAVGGLVGIMPLYLLFDGWTAATTGMNNLSQMMFNFELTIELMAQAMLLSVVIGLIGGIIPAIKAMRLPVTLALKEV